jgi:hypothetical protein
MTYPKLDPGKSLRKSRILALVQSYNRLMIILTSEKL